LITDSFLVGFFLDILKCEAASIATVLDPVVDREWDRFLSETLQIRQLQQLPTKAVTIPAIFDMA
jgi:hypothetical protein